MKEFLRVQRATEQQRKVAVRRLDDVCELVDREASVECFCIREAILEEVGKGHSRPEGLGDAAEERRIYNRCGWRFR